MTFADHIIQFNQSLQPNWEVPLGIDLLYPYDQAETMAALTAFYQKYYSDQFPRIYIFGINPGRFGAAITGVPFTDPVRLEEVCGIANPFRKRLELSSVFVYHFIEAFGRVEHFYQHFCITSICPLGFMKDGKNYNYYDNKKLEKLVTPHIIDHLRTLQTFPSSPAVALCMGQGKNYEYFQRLNEEHHFFEEIFPLPHPRWVMQYRRKRMDEYAEEYKDKLTHAIEL
ncbi:MAG: DUF4918 family protein, partial [Lewinella sp.]|nr:DUF4918 family protein [Lewinella sp.]